MQNNLRPEKKCKLYCSFEPQLTKLSCAIIFQFWIIFSTENVWFTNFYKLSLFNQILQNKFWKIIEGLLTSVVKRLSSTIRSLCKSSGSIGKFSGKIAKILRKHDYDEAIQIISADEHYHTLTTIGMYMSRDLSNLTYDMIYQNLTCDRWHDRGPNWYVRNRTSSETSWSDISPAGSIFCARTEKSHHFVMLCTRNSLIPLSVDKEKRRHPRQVQGESIPYVTRVFTEISAGFRLGRPHQKIDLWDVHVRRWDFTYNHSNYGMLAFVHRRDVQKYFRSNRRYEQDMSRDQKIPGNFRQVSRDEKFRWKFVRLIRSERS